MVDTNKYKTRTVFKNRKNPSLSTIWPIAIDIGYSSVKTFSPNAYTCFPSMVYKIQRGSTMISLPDNEYIEYEERTENGADRWFVGEYSLREVDDKDTSGQELGMVNFDRMNTKEYQIITRVGLALGLMKNQYGDPTGKMITVQTGLPPKHKADYTDILVDVIAGTHEFRIRTAATMRADTMTSDLNEKGWKYFKFTINKDNIDVMDQPMGALIGSITGADGKSTPDAMKIFTSNVLVADPGYGTVDTFSLKNHHVTNNYTWKDYGMSQIFEETCEDFSEQYGAHMPVSTLHKRLKDGTFKLRKKNSPQSKLVDFSNILAHRTSTVCNRFLDKLDSSYDYLAEYDYLIVSGGLGAAWYNDIQTHYGGNEALNVISATRNDDSVESIFSNVRGYYMYRYSAFADNPKYR